MEMMVSLQIGGTMTAKNGTFSKMGKSIMAMEKMLPERNFLTTENMQTGGMTMERNGIFSKKVKNIVVMEKMLPEKNFLTTENMQAGGMMLSLIHI